MTGNQRLFSDSASMYTTSHGGFSHLTVLGFYHFWINHSIEYAHSKFTFLTTGGIESKWGQMKSCTKGIVSAQTDA